MTPSARYQQKKIALKLLEDSAQTAVLPLLDTTYTQLTTATVKTSEAFWKPFLKKPSPAIKGLYLWGGVGRGKTLLMDIFCECLPVTTRRRVHFHRFMQQIHHELKQIQNTQNPLGKIALKIAATTQTLCLDEFHVNNITDAMLLARLLDELHKNRICLVTTSNLKPDDLYRDGLQRQRFLPAIDMLKARTQVINIDANIDYRLKTLQKNHLYHFPASPQTRQQLQEMYTEVTTGSRAEPGILSLNGRNIPVLGCTEGVIWFEFEALCNSPRSQTDYLEIACEHHSVFLSNLPALTDEQLNAATRFLLLIDILYDHRVKLIITAQTALTDIYNGTRLLFEYQRVTSRLIEMQSESYLQQPHIP